MDRLENLLGALSLTVTDRMRRSASEVSSSEQAAMITLLAHPDRPVAWVAAVLGLTDSGATRLADRLVRDGLVQRTKGSDGRRRELRLTAAGEERARDHLASRADALTSVTDGLPAADREQLERLLAELVGRLADTRLPALATCRLCDREACSDRERECPLEHTTTSSTDPYA